MKKWWFVVAASMTLAIVVVPRFIRYRRADLETLDLNDEVRKQAPGRFLRLPLGNLHYELAGPQTGPLVLLVPGFSTPYAVWDRTLPALAEGGFRVLRYDHFGRGLSDRIAARYDPEFFDREIQDLLDALNVVRKVDLVGEGMGGTIAATFVNRHPAHARKLALIDPDYRTGYEVPFRLRMPLARDYRIMMQVSNMAESQADDFVHPERASQYLEAYRRQMRYRGFRQAILSTILNYWPEDSTAEYRQLGKIGPPVLLLWGIADASTRFPLSVRVRADIPQAEFHTIQDAGHLPAYEHPEIVNPILIDFLRR